MSGFIEDVLCTWDRTEFFELTADRRCDRRTDGQTDKRTDGQTDRHNKRPRSLLVSNTLKLSSGLFIFVQPDILVFN